MTGEEKQYIHLTVELETEVSKHIPVTEVMLIICDFVSPVSPYKTKTWGKCEHCNVKHRRQQSNLCMNCKTICLICKGFDAVEKSLVCFHCMVRLPDHKTRALALSQTPKHIMYRELFCIRFASEIHYASLEGEKRRAAAEKEKKDKEDSFLRAQGNKPKDQQIAELREKLYAANKILSSNRFALGLKDPVPAYPYF